MSGKDEDDEWEDTGVQGAVQSNPVPTDTGSKEEVKEKSPTQTAATIAGPGTGNGTNTSASNSARILKISEWFPKENKTPVYKSSDLSGEPVGFLSADRPVLSIHQHSSGAEVIVEHEFGFTHSRFFYEPGQYTHDYSFSIAPHSTEGNQGCGCCGLILMCLVLCITLILSGHGILWMNHHYCSDYIKNDSWKQYVFACGTTHGGWTQDNVDYKYSLDSFVNEIRQTWDPESWDSNLEMFKQYLEFNHPQTPGVLVPSGHSCGGDYTLLSLPSKGRDLVRMLQMVKQRWDERSWGVTPDQFLRQMFRECPKSEPCPMCEEKIKNFIRDQFLQQLSRECPKPEPCPVCKETVATCPLQSSCECEGKSKNSSPPTPEVKQPLTEDIWHNGHKIFSKSQVDSVGFGIKYNPLYLGESYNTILLPVYATESQAILVNKTLLPNFAIFSPDSRYVMTMRKDCNLVVYDLVICKYIDCGGKSYREEWPAWSSITSGTYKERYPTVIGPSRQCMFKVLPRSIQVLDPSNKVVWERVQKEHEKDIREVRLTCDGSVLCAGPTVVT